MSEEMKIEVVGKLSRVDVRPGDVFVLHTDAQLSTKLTAHTRKWWDEKWGPGAPQIIIVSQGAQLGVIRRENLPPPPPPPADW